MTDTPAEVDDDGSPRLTDAPAPAPTTSAIGGEDGGAGVDSGNTARPRWELPAVLVIAVFAGITYAWGASHQALEVYYQAAVRSMGASWHDFFYGAFDPRGTITVDKLPGGLWVQALSVRLFGFHQWAIVLPQIVEGVVTVVVLHRAVRRLGGPLAGVVAAAVVAVTPVTVALARGNISDSLLVMLLVLAANSTASALRTGRVRWLLLAGFWVGLAFQAKMLQAWFVLPAIAAVWVLAGADRSWVKRVLQVAAAMALAVVVSLSWMVVVSLVPHHDRPYVDGSTHDSLFEQVFDYNGFNRIGHDQSTLSNSVSSSFASLVSFRLPNQPGPTRLLSGAGGRDVGWLVPAAVAAAVALAWRRRRERRTDLVRAGAEFWGLWLLIHFLAFSESTGINAYYLAALSPAIGALCGLAVAEFGPAAARSRTTTIVVLCVAAFTAAYAVWLTPDASAPHAVLAVVGVLVFAGAAWLALGANGRRAGIGLALALVAAAVLPLVATLDIVAAGLGPFDTPYQSAAATRASQDVPKRALADVKPGLPLIMRANKAQLYKSGIESSLVAAPLIVDSGLEFEPIGGFLGTSPYPSLTTIRHQIATGQVQTFITLASSDPRIVWIRDHCQAVPNVTGTPLALPGIGIYFCPPQVAGG